MRALLIPYLLYPIGFIAVIIGRAQLFTENTLYPVVLVLDERKHVRRTLRLWGVVFTSNIFGAFMFALLAVKTPALRADILSQFCPFGRRISQRLGGIFFLERDHRRMADCSCRLTVTASHWTIGQVAMVYMLTFIVGIGRFAHCVAGSGEILSAVMAGTVSLAEYLRWLMPATLGNICGGILMVSLLNYGQVKNL